MARYIGVDLHKSMIAVCIYTPSEEKFEDKKILLKEIDKFKEMILLKTDEVAVESTGNTRYFVDQIREIVKRVKVVNTKKFKAISGSVIKSDKRDAQTIAIHLAKGIIPEIILKDKEHKRVNSLANTRNKLVQLRTVLKNKIHNILIAHGYDTNKEMLSSDKGLDSVPNYAVDEVSVIELEVIVTQIKSLNESIKKLDVELEKRGKQLPGHENITSIKGIGNKSGAILLSSIGDITNYENDKKLASYFGLVPVVYGSNEKIITGHITKQGNKLARTTLVQCTLIAIRYSTYLRTFYEKVKGKKGSGKAIIATARKMVGIIYKTFKEKIIFEDFGNYVIKSAN